MENEKYLWLLSKEYPTIKAASSEIINLNAIRRLPKGTEYFFSDLHGESESFLHLLKSASGIIRTKITETFDNTMSEEEQNRLAHLIYYPERALAAITMQKKELEDWNKITIYRLVQMCRTVASKYTRSKVRKKMPKEFAYIIDELLHVDYSDENKKIYYSEIVHSIIENDMAETFIEALCRLIQGLTVDSLHIIGDIFDRGPRADLIMNELIQFHDVDIQWGNHDISWMGAATGSLVCIANVIRVGISYNNFDLLEDGYGINLRALSMFAAEVYKDDPCERFYPHLLDENEYDSVDPALGAKMHKAIAILQFKLEGQTILRHPEYKMRDRILLNQIQFKEGTVVCEGNTYPLLDSHFPTVDPANPLRLTLEEKELIEVLAVSFEHSSLLHKHVKFLYTNGDMYKCVNSNLLYHGCIPMKDDGEFEKLEFGGKLYSGKTLMDYVSLQVKNAYFLTEASPEKEDARDFMYYLWCGAKSPLFGKSKMAGFEGYFIGEAKLCKETPNPYYSHCNSEEICLKILEEFSLPSTAHIINGHMPVKLKDGESPVKGNGRLYVIDGGLSKAYQSKTGIAGYTLIYNSYHLALAEHKPFNRNQEQTPLVRNVEQMPKRMVVADTDIGKVLDEKIADLKKLVEAYKEGIIKEQLE